MSINAKLLIENTTLTDQNNHLKGRLKKIEHNMNTILRFLDGAKRRKNVFGNMIEIVFEANLLEGKYSELIALKDSEQNNAV